MTNASSFGPTPDGADEVDLSHIYTKSGPLPAPEVPPDPDVKALYDRARSRGPGPVVPPAAPAAESAQDGGEVDGAGEQQQAVDPNAPQSWDQVSDLDQEHPLAAQFKELARTPAEGARLLAMQRAHVEHQERTWRGESEALGADVIAAARRGIQTHGTPELLAVLDETGLGSHPAVVSHFAKLAGRAPDASASSVNRLYPTMAGK